jgi:hypothetical protein
LGEVLAAAPAAGGAGGGAVSEAGGVGVPAPMGMSGKLDNLVSGVRVSVAMGGSVGRWGGVRQGVNQRGRGRVGIISLSGWFPLFEAV